MRCFHPLEAFLPEDGGKVTFRDTGHSKGVVSLRCGRCIGCRLERSRQWAVRCMHESQMHESNCFITLTYDDNHYCHSLDYTDFQYFMRMLRRKCGKVRFYMCGEYGEEFDRPHFHACLFGYRFPDGIRFKKAGDGYLYRSPLLESLWPYGFSSFGDVTPESAAYVASYVMKKVFGSDDYAARHYERVNIATGELVSVTPEFSRMSLKPGIGAEWFKKFGREVYGKDGALDRVIISGRPCKPPRYYDMLYSLLGTDVDYVKFKRSEKAQLFLEDNTPERLRVLEEVATARVNLKKRVLQ